MPPASGAEALGKAIPHATLKLFPHAGHNVFVGTRSSVGRVFIRTGCGDPDGTDRAEVNAEAIGLALDCSAATLR